MKIEIKEMNNKTRKGRYVYLKEKGRRGSYYKYNTNIEMDYYIERYNSKVKRIGMKKFKQGKAERQTKKIIKKTKAKPRLQKQINKGGTNITRTIEELNGINVINEYQRLLRPLVLNRKLLKIVIQNREKLKTNLTHEVTIKGIVQDTGTPGLLTTMIYHNMSIEKLINKLNGIKKGMIVSSKIMEKYADNNQTIRYNKKGLAREITIKTTFKK